MSSRVVSFFRFCGTFFLFFFSSVICESSCIWITWNFFGFVQGRGELPVAVDTEGIFVYIKLGFSRCFWDPNW